MTKQTWSEEWNDINQSFFKLSGVEMTEDYKKALNSMAEWWCEKLVASRQTDQDNLIKEVKEMKKGYRGEQYRYGLEALTDFIEKIKEYYKD